MTGTWIKLNKIRCAVRKVLFSLCCALFHLKHKICEVIFNTFASVNFLNTRTVAGTYLDANVGRVDTVPTTHHLNCYNS